MDNLGRVIDILKDEELLIKQSMSRDDFYIENLLQLIHNDNMSNTDFFMAQVEKMLIMVYDKIKNNILFAEYIKNMEMIIQNPLSEKTINTLDNILNKMRKINTNVNDLIIIKMT
jgi:hypothetical protein